MHVVSLRPLESGARNGIWAGNIERLARISRDVGSRFLIPPANVLRRVCAGWARMSQRAVNHPPRIAVAFTQS